MAYCSKCGHQLADGVKFCNECGASTYDKSVLERPETQRKVSFEGEVRVCPQCKEVINAFVSQCPSCGHEMRGFTTTSVVRELSMKLERTPDVSEKEELEKQLAPLTEFKANV